MTAVSVLGFLALAFGLAVLAGAASGVRIGGEFLGTSLAAMMGAFFAPTAVLPAAMLGLALLAWLH